jgi:hypothetical protein
MTPRGKASSQPAVICGECQQDLAAAGRRDGPVVHCVRSIWPMLQPRVHHGRRRWACPRCGAALGCDVCSRRQDAFCEACRIFADGRAELGFSADELKLLVRLATHVSPARGIGARQAAEMGIDPGAIEARVEALTQSLQRKGVLVQRIDRAAPLAPAYFCASANRRRRGRASRMPG